MTLPVPIIMPQLGESIAEAKIVNILVNPGDPVTSGQDVLEVETNKATMTVTAPCAGKIARWIIQVGQSYPVGDVLGQLEASAEEAAKLGLDLPQPTPPAASSSNNGQQVLAASPALPQSSHTVEPTVKGLPVPAHARGASYMSPRMKARMHELGLHAADLAGVAGSGADGRVTIEDFEKFLASLEKNETSPASTMRVAVADAMRRSWTRPIATVGLPICLDPLLAHRRTCNPKPGPTLYAVRALALALAENSTPAGRLVGKHIIHPPSIDIGFAVEADDGVLVPVFRKVDQTPLLGLIEPYSTMVELARKRQLPQGATGGSIATVTNFGTFGLMWATPIPLPEQTLVLGLGSGRKTPFWDEEKGQFIPIMEANLTLSFDHRVIDGGAAGRLLSRIADLMNSPDLL